MRVQVHKSGSPVRHSDRGSGKGMGSEREPALSLPSELRDALRTARECAEKEGWFTVDLHVQVQVQQEDEGAVRSKGRGGRRGRDTPTSSELHGGDGGDTGSGGGDGDEESGHTVITWLIAFLGPVRAACGSAFAAVDP